MDKATRQIKAEVCRTLLQEDFRSSNWPFLVFMLHTSAMPIRFIRVFLCTAMRKRSAWPDFISVTLVISIPESVQLEWGFLPHSCS